MQIRLTDLELKETTVSAAIRAPFNKAAYPAVLSSTYMTQLLISVHTVMMVRFGVALHAPRHAASASTVLTWIWNGSSLLLYYFVDRRFQKQNSLMCVLILSPAQLHKKVDILEKTYWSAYALDAVHFVSHLEAFDILSGSCRETNSGGIQTMLSLGNYCFSWRAVFIAMIHKPNF